MTKKELIEDYNINENEFTNLKIYGEDAEFYGINGKPGKFYCDDECWDGWDINEFYGYLVVNDKAYQCYYHPTAEEIVDLSSIDYSNPVRVEEK